MDYITKLEKRNEELEEELQKATNKISELEKDVSRWKPNFANDVIFSGATITGPVSANKGNGSGVTIGYDISPTISPKLEERIKKLETHIEQLSCPFYVRWYKKLKLLLKK
jgi:hypothetical protein